jgi:hypothetical protein
MAATASRDRCPRGGPARTAATGQTRPARQLGTAQDEQGPSGGNGGTRRRDSRHAAQQHRSQQPGGHQADGDPGACQRGVLGGQHQHDLHRGEAERLQHAELGVLHQYPAAGHVHDGEHGSAQGHQPEQCEQQPEQGVAPGHGLLHLLPGRHASDCAAAQLGHGLLDDQTGRAGVGDPQADDLLGVGPVGLDLLQQCGQHPDQARSLVRIEPLLRRLRQAGDARVRHRAVHVLERQHRSDVRMNRFRERRLQHDSVEVARLQPVAGHPQRTVLAGRHRGRHGLQFDPRALSGLRQPRGGCLVRSGDRVDARHPLGQPGRVGPRCQVQPDLGAPGRAEQALPGVGRALQQRRRQQQGSHHAGDDRDHRQGLTRACPQVGPYPAGDRAQELSPAASARWAAPSWPPEATATPAALRRRR